ncbi:replication-associated recombination protein A [Calorimonas adulescens]|jgi:Holliday junction DNA helicase ruvB N-terminus./MgsA AAA+ ATPase C terminal.|uniref:Replication-associated recombination protein A n=1 Tax=Calorimonas adulescens TaxID=2606906 RepID=A0A5D8QGG6_9THEO|nr:replication-associated recombination protein A [Calorimonas adulescens]TZE83497.1 replication-associated recombination protein A [Calorimonas adulescens]
MDLFEYSRQKNSRSTMPLAMRMRPDTLDEFVGQGHILGKGKVLRRAIEADRLTSLILYGPPGTGKTSLAHIIANTTKSHFERINAVTSGVADIKRVIQEASDRLGMYNKKTIVFIDEIHRFNKAQQDALLPAVEDGTIILIGATTENPYFEVNSALISRSLVVELKKLTRDDILAIILKAIKDENKGLGRSKIKIDDAAIKYLCEIADGDARVALNALELAYLTTPPDSNGVINLDVNTIADSAQHKVLKYDKDGDNHYDIISAFIKSMRGSDPDAVLYWLARMIEAGEDPKFIARRIMICASEDVGNADPRAIIIATAASQAVERIGMPEGRIILAQAALYVACAPKSNSTIIGIDMALEDVKRSAGGEVPAHLKDAHYDGAGKLGHGVGYKYAHDFPNHYVKQQYLPRGFEDKKYYNPTEQGYEAKIKQWLEFLRSNC